MKRFTKEEWEKGFKIIDKVRSHTKNIPQEVIEKTIEEAVKEVRLLKFRSTINKNP